MQTPHVSVATTKFLCFAILMSGCLEVNTTTEVRRDGSLVRTVVVKGDSSSIQEVCPYGFTRVPGSCSDE
jgi:hypothetical protein